MSKNRVRIDFFRQRGVWEATEYIKWIGEWNNETTPSEEFLKSLQPFLKDHKKYFGMTVVCIKPFHKYSHPVLLKVEPWMMPL